MTDKTDKLDGMVEVVGAALANCERRHKDTEAYWLWLHEEERAKFRNRARAALQSIGIEALVRDAERYVGIRAICVAERDDVMPPLPQQKSAESFDAWVDGGIAAMEASSGR